MDICEILLPLVFHQVLLNEKARWTDYENKKRLDICHAEENYPTQNAVSISAIGSIS